MSEQTTPQEIITNVPTSEQVSAQAAEVAQGLIDTVPVSATPEAAIPATDAEVPQIITGLGDAEQESAETVAEAPQEPQTNEVITSLTGGPDGGPTTETVVSESPAAGDWNQDVNAANLHLTEAQQAQLVEKQDQLAAMSGAMLNQNQAPTAEVAQPPVEQVPPTPTEIPQ